MSNELDLIGVKHGTDKSSIHHDFLRLYDSRLAPFKNQPIALFEFGVYNGASLRMWAEYFPRAHITGVDFNLRTDLALADNVRTVAGDSSDPFLLSRLLAEFGRPDIVIDDASHRWDHQIATFHYLFPALSPGGIYIIEDIDTSFDGHKNAYSGYAKLSAFDYIQKLSRVVTAAGALGTERPDDLFIADWSPRIQSIEFAPRTCLIHKK